MRVGRLRRDRGISVARPTALGNPFEIGTDGDRGAVIAKYREWFAARLGSDENIERQLARIAQAAKTKGEVTLLCWCSPKPCHAEIVAEEVRRRLACHG